MTETLVGVIGVDTHRDSHTGSGRQTAEMLRSISQRVPIDEHRRYIP